MRQTVKVNARAHRAFCDQWRSSMACRYLIALLFALMLAACGRDEPATETTAAAPEPAPASAEPTPAPAAVADVPPVAPDAATIEPELPKECGELIANYERCIENHMPESGRDLLREALAKSREQWQQAARDATTEATREQLSAACRQSKTELQAQMSGYGCIL
jgi:hypothetical protein